MNNTLKVALFTNARDELHIREWAAHHLLIGFDYIIIFDHKSKTPLKTVFHNYDKRVKIKDASHLQGSIKTYLMNYASNLAKKNKIDWILYLDADEFLILNNKFMGVKHFLCKYNFAHSIGINWLMFGSNHLKNEPKDLIFNSYTKSNSSLDRHVKSFTKTSKIINADNPHFYNIKNKNKMYGINGKILTGMPAFNEINTPYRDVSAYIAHFIFQSEETYRNRKCLLPTDDTGTYRNITDDDIKNMHSKFNDVDNFYPKNKYSENIKIFLQQFK